LLFLIRQFREALSHGFWMGKFEVTQAQWQRVMGATLRQQRAKDPGRPRPVGDGTTRDHVGEGPDHPTYYTSHFEAEEFCRKLTEAERGAGRLELGWEYRLPTEAQWEFACRAGTTTATAFGDRLSSTQANLVPQNLPRMDRRQFDQGSWQKCVLMVIDDFHIVRIALMPAKAKPGLQAWPGSVGGECRSPYRSKT
jgi:formylglycine-generating enzyme required for sulfatase activity